MNSMQNTMRKTITGLMLAAGLAASSAGVWAQSAPSPTPGPAASAPQGKQQRATPEQRQARMQEHFKKFSSQLHDKLKLNANQESAWNTYLQAITPQPPQGQRPDRAQIESMTTPQRMEQHLARMKEHEAKLSQRLEATKVFYGQLTPEQQKVFDTETARMFKGRHGMHGDHGHHHGQGKPQPR